MPLHQSSLTVVQPVHTFNECGLSVLNLAVPTDLPVPEPLTCPY
jgi:hypothetical protein